MYITSGLSNHANINNIISKVNYRLSLLKVIFKFTERRTKLILINSIIVSVFRYCCPLLIDSNCTSLNKLQTLLMKCARTILGFRSLKMTTVKIMKELNMVTIHHMIMKESIMFIHKVLFNGGPHVILKMMTFSLNNNPNIRSVRKPMMANYHKSQKVIQSLFYRSIHLYNMLDHDLKLYNPKKLSKHLQKYIQYLFPNNKIPKIETNK